MKAGAAKVGMKVWVYAMGSYYEGVVIRVTEAGAEAEYASGAGNVRKKWFPSSSGIYAVKGLERFPLVELVEGAAKPVGARGLKAAGLPPEPSIYEKARRRREGEA